MIRMITGHLGSGKTLLAVRLAQQYLEQGRRVATNLTLNPDHLVKATDRQTIHKLPYIPKPEHLQAMGRGYPKGNYDEKKFGLLLLDECGSWLNSQDWKDKDRRGLFTWITHARKHGWDVALIIQDWESLDAQIRRSVCECYVSCSRTDRIKVPFLPIKLPRCHVATERYQGPNGPKMGRWYTRGTDLFKAFDTEEAIRPEEVFTETGPIDVRTSISLLSAWHLRGRYLPPRLTFADLVSVFLGLAIVAVVGGFLEACLGRSPWQASRAVWRRFLASREPSPYLALAEASRAA